MQQNELPDVSGVPSRTLDQDEKIAVLILRKNGTTPDPSDNDADTAGLASLQATRDYVTALGMDPANSYLISDGVDVDIVSNQGSSSTIQDLFDALDQNNGNNGNNEPTTPSETPSEPVNESPSDTPTDAPVDAPVVDTPAPVEETPDAPVDGTPAPVGDAPSEEAPAPEGSGSDASTPTDVTNDDSGLSGSVSEGTGGFTPPTDEQAGITTGGLGTVSE